MLRVTCSYYDSCYSASQSLALPSSLRQPGLATCNFSYCCFDAVRFYHDDAHTHMLERGYYMFHPCRPRCDDRTTKPWRMQVPSATGALLQALISSIHRSSLAHANISPSSIRAAYGSDSPIYVHLSSSPSLAWHGADCHRAQPRQHLAFSQLTSRNLVIV